MNPDDIKSILELLEEIQSKEKKIFKITSSKVDNDQRQEVKGELEALVIKLHVLQEKADTIREIAEDTELPSQTK